MFWKTAELKEGRPVKIPAYIGKHVVEEMQKMPQTSDHWVSYKAVVRPQAGKADSWDIRIFDEWETNEKGIKVADFAFLDAHPELIRFDGWFNAKTHTVDVKTRMQAVKAEPKAKA